MGDAQSCVLERGVFWFVGRVWKKWGWMGKVLEFCVSSKSGRFGLLNGDKNVEVVLEGI